MSNTQLRPNIGVGIGVFIMKDDMFLLGLRKSLHGVNTWAPPGGHLEFGETWEDCAVRETLEETGLTIANIQVLGVTNDVFSDTQKHYITIHARADWVSGKPEVLEPTKCQRWEWHTHATLPQNLFLPTKDLFEQYPHLSLS